MSGYVVKRIREKLICEDCKKSLKGDQRQGGLIFTRQYESARRGLVFPSRFVFKALCIAESVLRCELEKDWLGKKYFFDYANIKICNSFVSIHSVMMKQKDNHCYELLKEQHDESSFISLSLYLSSLSYTGYIHSSKFYFSSVCPFNSFYHAVS